MRSRRPSSIPAASGSIFTRAPLYLSIFFCPIRSALLPLFRLLLAQVARGACQECTDVLGLGGGEVLEVLGEVDLGGTRVEARQDGVRHRRHRLRRDRQ